MMKFALVAFALVAVAYAQHQYVDPKTAAIISEQRYLGGNGQFGAAYQQEDGTDFKEETDADGTRHGSYSYIDPTGQKRTVSYTAGKDGFRATGDHLPVAPAAPPHAAAPAAPQYVQQQQPAQHFASAPIAPRFNADYEDGQYDERWNDPSFQGQNGRAAAPAPSPQQPQYVHQQQAAPQQPQYVHQQQAAPQQPQYVPQQAYYPTTTTPNPHRFQPPGKLALSRTHDGFSFSFNKN